MRTVALVCAPRGGCALRLALHHRTASHTDTDTLHTGTPSRQERRRGVRQQNGWFRKQVLPPPPPHLYPTPNKQPPNNHSNPFDS